MKSALVIRPRMQEVVISKGSCVLVSQPRPVRICAGQTTGGAVIMAGQRGRPGVGIPGPPGGTVLQRKAGEVISALRAVYELDGSVFYLDPEDSGHVDLLLGIAITSAPSGQLLNVQRAGVLDDLSWRWAPGPVWLGPLGSLTQSPPTAGYDLLIGSAVSATRINLNLQDPIELE